MYQYVVKFELEGALAYEVELNTFQPWNPGVSLWSPADLALRRLPLALQGRVKSYTIRQVLVEMAGVGK